MVELNETKLVCDEEYTTNCFEKVETFDELNLKENILRGIYAFGWNSPSYIQQVGILPIVKGRDLIAQAQSGSGKTGCFVIGALQLIDFKCTDVQVLLLSPTKEISLQSYNVFKLIGQYLDLKIENLVGGTTGSSGIKNLKEGLHVVVGTPGRILNLLDKKLLKISSLKLLILDEADNLLSRGFLDDMKKVISMIPTECRITLVSATMPKEVVNLTEQFMTDPARILVESKDVAVKGIKQYYLPLKREWKLEVLENLYKSLSIVQAWIFCNSKTQVDRLTEEMKKKGHQVSKIHSELSMEERTKVMEEFRNGVSRVLISTDLTSRGIDVYQVSIVINYDFPYDKETYIHRIGRAGRHGKKGVSITFICPDEQETLEKMKSHYDMDIEKLPNDLSEIEV